MYSPKVLKDARQEQLNSPSNTCGWCLMMCSLIGSHMNAEFESSALQKHADVQCTKLVKLFTFEPNPSVSSAVQEYRVACIGWYVLVFQLRTRLQQVSESMLRQICNDAIDSVPIENKEVAPEWVARHFRVQYHQCHHRVVAALMLTLGVNGTLVL